MYEHGTREHGTDRQRAVTLQDSQRYTLKTPDQESGEEQVYGPLRLDKLLTMALQLLRTFVGVEAFIESSFSIIVVLKYAHVVLRAVSAMSNPYDTQSNGDSYGHSPRSQGHQGQLVVL